MSQVLLVDGFNDAYDRVRWKWAGGDTLVGATAFGDPVSGVTSYSFCIYDTIGGTPTLALGAAIPGGGTCGTRPCWRTTRTGGFLYLNRAGTPDGIKRMQLQFTTDRRGAGILLGGSGYNVRMPVPAQPFALLNEDPAVTVQLQRTASEACWEGTVLYPPANNTAKKFRDLSLE